MTEEMLGKIVSLVFLAIALGMDAFSISLGLGMQNKVRLKRVFVIGIIIGVFHVFMPLIGMILGKVISNQIGQLTSLVGGLLLAGIGAQMFFSAFNHEAQKLMNTTGLGLLIFAFTVSMDSFSVGLSLGISGAKTIIVIILFGMISMFLTWIGMVLGRKVHHLLGVYSEMLGGSILFSFGLYIIFS